MALCQLEPRPDMYGLGIRLAFYVAWFGALFIEAIDETDLADVRFLGVLLSAAEALALVIQVANDDLRAADIYISLLLASGIFIFLVPLYAWKAVSLCHPYWDPTRWTKERPSPIYRFCHYVLLIVVASLGTWFYTTYLPGLDEGCDQFGFIFAKINVKNNGFIVPNAMLSVIILVVCAGILFQALGWWCILLWPKEHKRKKAPKMHREFLRTFRTLSNMAVFGVLVAAVELTVQWNGVDDGTGSLDTAAQTIPLVVSAGVVLRVLFLHYAGVDEDDDHSSGRTVLVGNVTERRRTVIDEKWPGRPPSARTR